MPLWYIKDERIFFFFFLNSRIKQRKKNKKKKNLIKTFQNSFWILMYNFGRRERFIKRNEILSHIHTYIHASTEIIPFKVHSLGKNEKRKMINERACIKGIKFLRFFYVLIFFLHKSFSKVNFNFFFLLCFLSVCFFLFF